MKAYAIKNKDGKYKREDIIEYIWKEATSYFSKDIRCADIFTEEEMAKCYCPKDCKVVEITIAEGDLKKEIEHWHNLFKQKEQQFQSVRERYHLLNRLQANYDKKDKLHLSEMQCLELVEKNEKLEQQLAVLERALKNTCWLLYGTYDEHYPNYFIEKAKKELKGEKDE